MKVAALNLHLTKPLLFLRVPLSSRTGLALTLLSSLWLSTPQMADAAKRKSNQKPSQKQNTPAASESAARKNSTPEETHWLPQFNKALKSAGFKSNELGLWVSRHDRIDEAAFEQNGATSFIPASISKVPTAAAILSLLPPSTQFKTVISADRASGVQANGTIADGILKGPLYLIGGGDPSFISESLWFLVNELTRTQIKVIEGDLIVDDSRFDSIRFDQDREDRRVDRAYDAPIGALSLNWNSATAWVRPGASKGSAAQVTLDLMSPYLSLQNKTKTNGGGNSISVERLNGQSNGPFETIVASGSIGVSEQEKAYYKNVREPALWVGYGLIEFLKQRGIEFKGKIKAGRAPESAIVLATAKSKSLLGIVTDMMKWSNNYVAEMLVKNLAAEGVSNGSSSSAQERPATMATGLKHVRSWLESNVGFKPGEYEYINAAGFTRSNRFTPRQLGQILTTVRKDFRVFPEFMTALPIAGVDGTLRSRMKRAPNTASSDQSLIRAKTGLLNGVVGLAGYVGNSKGHLHTFVFLYNGSSSKEVSARALFDRLATIIAADISDSGMISESIPSAFDSIPSENEGP